ncbi:RidA family protein [Aneurinibacillus migulanus]|uniref:Reactive intermediate/imine deaminase n=1 Tax=Aneurinibacillus migulanus TaxID=47500 RepID=A0A0D1X663_ANEMI|nr:RidA family protein [Aneurinibacillus migulanus]KIV50006.1 hypothetical protein TS65_31255 [Aneurinibacillus migulanus]KON97805.1 hypothetical protein AF333_22595 [Aneurinibacillus migulanus]MED0895063.1 RidA family protein [Aneurinibacillus migulanus]MED1619404.1 RidA family protein [Aneurinibacillus migulanus]SDJ73958.1 reactive intermediate/imine deaminase [Aneurinibacillus migulanus]
MKEVINTKLAPGAIGPYSQGTKWKDLIFTSGQIPLDPKTGDLVEGDIEVQARRTLENLKAVIEASGSSITNVLKTTCYITDMNHFQKFNSVYQEYFREGVPARSCIAVVELPKGALCEVEAIAVIKEL